MKILITGGLGYIGSIAVVNFEKAGFETIILDKLSNSKIEVLDKIEKILGYKPKFYKVDLLDKGGLQQVFKENKIDGVIHFAGLKAVGESCQKPLLYFNNNITGSLNLFDLMQKFNVKNIIFSSSATVYNLGEISDDLSGGLSDDLREISDDLSGRLSEDSGELVEKIGNDVILRRGLKETDPTGNTTNPYGRTKFILENILEDLAKFAGFKAISLRYFNPIGAHPSGLLGEDPNGIPNNLLPYIFKVLKGELDYLRIFGNDYPTKDGTGIRDYIDVNDLVDGHLKAWKYLENKKAGFYDVFNLGVGRGVSVLEMVKLVEQVSGKKIPYKIVERRPGDLAAVWCNPGKAKKLLNWEAKIDIKESIRNGLRFEGMGEF